MQAVAKAAHIDIEDLVAAINRPQAAEGAAEDVVKARIRSLVNDVRWTPEREISVRRIMEGFIDIDKQD